MNEFQRERERERERERVNPFKDYCSGMVG
jgi:hypothetical protein